MENKIKEIRANTGLSQARFGEAYHIPKRTVQDWESGRRTPPYYVVDLLAFKVQDDLKKLQKGVDIYGNAC